MTSYALRDYQEFGISEIRREFAAGNRQVLLTMPTGAGKTLTASDMLSRTYARGKSILWLTDREELADQASEAFARAGIPHSFIMAGTKADRFGRAWVGTIQSFLAWRKANPHTGEPRQWTPDRVDFIVIDEAHRTQAASFQRMLACYPDAYLLGLTATPMRGDGQGLGKTYKALVVPITMRELLDRGVLLPGRYFIPSEPDFSTLQRSRTGDFTTDELAAWADANPQLVGDAVENFARVCPDRRFVAFCPDIRTSVALRDRMNAAGFPCVHIDGTTEKGERRRRMEAFRSGEAQGLTAVDIAVEGLDVPDVSAVIFMRPTKSERIWVQAVGRGLRSYGEQRDCIVLDHSGTLMTFGPAEDFMPPPLHSNSGKQSKGSARQSKREKAQTRCEGVLPDGAECGALLIGTNVCPECGHEHHTEAPPKHQSVIPGELEELTTEGRERHIYELDTKKRWYGELLGYCRNRGKSPDMAYHVYLAKFGEKPLWAWRDSIAPTQPGAEVLAFCKHRSIAYARSQHAPRPQPQAAD